MLKRWSGVLVVLGLIVGYSVAGTSVNAQNEPLPFGVGDTVSLRFGAPWSAEYNNFTTCAVAEIRGSYVRCEAPPAPAGRQTRVMWHNLQSVAVVETYQ